VNPTLKVFFVMPLLVIQHVPYRTVCRVLPSYSGMPHVFKAERITALKALLRDLENTRLIYPDDIDILSLKRDLKTKIASLEKTQEPIVEGCEAQAMAAD
jgi:hypothetical protein